MSDREDESGWLDNRGHDSSKFPENENPTSRKLTTTQPWNHHQLFVKANAGTGGSRWF
jgi:hypothetical protein